MTTTEQFYLRDSRTDVGSCAMFWALSGGYTSDLSKAEKFTRERAILLHNSRETDIPVRCDLADQHSYRAVDMQLLPKPSVCDGLNYLVVEGRYDGNNVLFRDDVTRSHSLELVTPVVGDRASEAVERSGGGISAYPADAIEQIARPVVAGEFLDTRTVLRKAKIRMNPRLRARRQTSGKHRSNCPACGRIVWDWNPYEPAYCTICWRFR